MNESVTSMAVHPVFLFNFLGIGATIPKQPESWCLQFTGLFFGENMIFCENIFFCENMVFGNNMALVENKVFGENMILVKILFFVNTMFLVKSMF